MTKPRKLNNGGGVGRVSGLADGSAVTAKHDLFLIDDETINDPRIKDQVFCPVSAGTVMGHGLVPRKHSVYPAEMFAAPPAEMPLIASAQERFDRAKELVANRATLRELLREAGIGSLNQGPNGYCWGHSTVQCVQVARCRARLPYVPLSAYSVCATIMEGKNEGGWCGLSAKFLRERGCMPQSIWPQMDRNYTRYDRPENWAEAAKYKVTGEWVDLTRNVYDQNLTDAQSRSAHLFGHPTAEDFNWWAHSVPIMDEVPVEGGSCGKAGLNSWGDAWGDGGWFVLRGDKALCDGAVCIYHAGAA